MSTPYYYQVQIYTFTPHSDTFITAVGAAKLQSGGESVAVWSVHIHRDEIVVYIYSPDVDQKGALSRTVYPREARELIDEIRRLVAKALAAA